MMGEEEKAMAIRDCMNSALYNGCGTQMGVAIVLFIILLFSSCATKTKVEYIEKEVIKYETKIQHDTLINNVHDSIRIETKGDTVFVDRWHTAIKERIVNKTDTCWRDSIRTEIKENTIEKLKTPKWCYYCLGLCVLFVIFASIKLLRWLRLI